MSKTIAVIPARWASTRFPNKMVAPLGGKPLVRWAVERALQAKTLDQVVLATDHAEIAEAVEGLPVEVRMTRADHPSGTDRVAEALEGLEAEIVINLQGDEPLLDPALVDRLVGVLAEDAGWDMATAATPIRQLDELLDPSVVKVVWGEGGRAFYFSRSVIPHQRDPEGGAPWPEDLYWRHLGIYGYRASFLKTLVATPPTRLEQTEKLEQLRALHIGCAMKVLPVAEAAMGVDTPEDLARVEKQLLGVVE
jgi:3-deoxy-manno-octulosonate cytidylyltransferase (CMP-KDO synthetase)